MPQKKRLLYIGNKLAIHGKPPTAIDLLSKNLQNEGYFVLTASSKKNRLARIFEMLIATVKSRKKIDLVLMDTYSTQNFYYAVLIGRICRILNLAYIPILHGGNLPSRLKQNSRLSKSLFKNAFINVAPSKFMMAQFQKQGYNNLKYIPNSVDIDNYPFKLRKSLAAKLLWVRSFSEIYNPLLAVEIVESLQKKGINVSLTMLGPDKDGTMIKCKKVASELNLPIDFPGMMPKKDWISLSQDYDIFINTTDFDNMPVSVMEAMALGLPVVSTNVGGLSFLIEDQINGILVPPKNAEVFVEAILELINNPMKVENITRNARKKVETFDWEHVKQKWNEVLS